MKKFQSIFTRLVHKREKEAVEPPSFWDHCRSNENTQVETSITSSHSLCRLRWSHQRSSTQYARACRSRNLSAGGLQKSSEPNDAALHPSSSATPPDGALVGHRAPIFTNVQPARSPRPPFEESVRTLTRRTPGSEDATSVGNEIGYPVVGPATVRPGIGISGTLHHQDTVMYTHDVFTNTPQTENFHIPANRLTQTFMEAHDIPPDESHERNRVAAAVDEGLLVSAESQTIPRIDAMPLLLLPQMPMSSQTASIESILLDEDTQPNERSATTTPGTDVTQTATVFPIQRSISPRTSMNINIAQTEASSQTPLLRQPSADQVQQTLTSQQPPSADHLVIPQPIEPVQVLSAVHFPVQLRRNRSNTVHSSGPSRRLTPTCDDIASIETTYMSSGKQVRAVGSPVSTVHCDSRHDAPAECFPLRSCGNQPVDKTPSGAPIEIMIHSLDCPGNCEKLSRLEDPPIECKEGSLPKSATSVKSLRNGCRDALLVPSLNSDAQKLSLNVMTCISWSDLPNNLTVTDTQGSPVENARVKIIPCGNRLTETENPDVYPDAGQDFPESTFRLSESFQNNENISDVSRGMVTAITASSNNDEISTHSVSLDSAQHFSKNDVTCSLQMSEPLLSSISAAQGTYTVSAPLKVPASPKKKKSSIQSGVLGLLSLGHLNDDYFESATIAPTPPHMEHKTSHQEHGSIDHWNDNYPDEGYKCSDDNHDTENSGRQFESFSPISKSQACGSHRLFQCSLGTSTSTLNNTGSVWDMIHTKNIATYQHIPRCLENQVHCADCASKRVRHSKIIDDEVITPADTCACIPRRPSLNKPVLVLNMSDKEISADLGTPMKDCGSLKSIDMQNHLFVRRQSGTSVASSVYIASDGKPTVINNGQTLPYRSASSVSQSRQMTADGHGAPATGAIPKRDTGARPKVGMRGESVGARRRTFTANDDSSSRDRSSMEENPTVGVRGHRVINDRSRGRVRNQLTSRKYHFAVKPETHRTPHKCGRRLDSPVTKKHPADSRGSTKRPGSTGLAIDELKSIWVNPETERSFPSSTSTIEINADLSQTLIVSDRKTLSPTLAVKSRSPRSRPSSRSPRRSAGGYSEAEPNISLFECVMCRDYLKPPIRQCNEGHSICKNCICQGNNCPVCQSPMRAEPNKVLDSLVQTIHFPCKNSSAGCKETYSIEEHAQHEWRCQYRLRSCPYANRSNINCKWSGVRSGIRSHMKRAHGHSGVVHSYKAFFPVETFDARVWENRTHDVEVLFVENEIFELHKVFDVRKACMWGFLRHILAKDPTKFSYTVRFQPQNFRASVSFFNEAIGGAEELDEAFSKGKRFLFYLNSFTTGPLETVGIQLKVAPNPNALFHKSCNV